MFRYTVYLIQCRNSEDCWIDFSRDQPTIDGLPERLNQIRKVSEDAEDFRIIKRTIEEEVMNDREVT